MSSGGVKLVVWTISTYGNENYPNTETCTVFNSENKHLTNQLCHMLRDPFVILNMFNPHGYTLAQWPNRSR